MHYILINKMTTKPEKRQQVMDILLEAGRLFDNDRSCLMYLVGASSDDPNVIWVQDVWKNKADHESAMQSEEMAKYIKQSLPLLESMPEQFQVEPVGGKSDLL